MQICATLHVPSLMTVSLMLSTVTTTGSKMMLGTSIFPLLVVPVVAGCDVPWTSATAASAAEEASGLGAL